MDVVIEVDEESVDLFLHEFWESFDVQATISYTQVKIGDYIMFRDSFHIGKVLKFLQHRHWPNRYFILYAVPYITYPVEIRHDALEWRMFTKQVSEDHYFIQDISKLYAHITLFDWSKDNYVVVTCDAFSQI